tara:strand:+ start:5670 stop:6350 length:681 start_codon:yes stop_codon:yes gene_type:complete
MDKIIIFGVGKISEVISYYATEVCGLNVEAYTVDSSHMNKKKFLDKPVISFKSVEKKYPPNLYKMFIAIGYHDLNKLRQQKLNEAEQKGYEIISIIAELNNLPKNVTYGKNCFIMPLSLIQPCVKLEDNVFVFSGALIGHHSHIEKNCWITSNASIGGNVKIGKNTFLAMDSIITHSVSIGDNCFIGSNTQILKNLDNNKVVISEGSKPIKLSSDQFLKFSNFSSI